MDAVNVFKILLNKDQPIYMVGEDVSGAIYFEISERFKINKLKLNFIGEGQIYWTKTKSVTTTTGAGKKTKTNTKTTTGFSCH